MKTAVLFSLVFLVLAIAFLNPASGCDCVEVVSSVKSLTLLNTELKNAGLATISTGLAKEGIQAVCSAASKAIKDALAKIPCDG